MTQPVTARLLVAATLAAASLGGCASSGSCQSDSCQADARTSAEVRAELSRHPALGSADEIRVRTSDHVVYLYGLVETDFDRQIAESAASDAASPDRVVSLIAVNNR